MTHEKLKFKPQYQTTNSPFWFVALTMAFESSFPLVYFPN